MSASPKIFELVANHGCLPMLPGPWARLLCAHGFMGPIAVGAQLLDKLKAKFSAEDLVESGVAVLDDHGDVSLHSRWIDRDAIFFAARKAETASPLDLVVADGELTGNLSALSLLADYRTQVALQHNGNELFLAFSLPDVAILRTFGLPVILADGLQSIRGKHLNDFCEVLGLGRRPPTEAEIDRQFRQRQPRVRSLDRSPPTAAQFGSPRGNRKPVKRPISLTFVGWSVAALDLTEPARLTTVREHFQQLVTNLGVELDDLRIWTPSHADLGRFRFCLEHGDKQDISAAVQESIELERVDLVHPNPAQETVPRTYGEAMMGWIKAERESGDAERKKRSWDQMQRLHEAELMDPLLQRAQETPDAVERNLVNVLAQLCRTLNPQAAMLAAQYGKAARESGSKASVVPPKDELQRVLALADRVRAIARELQPCRRKSK